MKPMLLPLLAVALCGAALPPGQGAQADRLQAQIVAAAAALSPSELSFERITRLERKGGGSTVKQTRTERWDGAQWALISVNGETPRASERARAARENEVPGYHQLARIMAAATERKEDERGRTVLLVPVLPKGSVMAEGKDISSHLRGEAVLGMRAGRPWVERLTLAANEPFKLNLLIKVIQFEQVNDYRLDANGQPRLMAQSNGSVGTMFGISGGEKSEVLYAYR